MLTAPWALRFEIVKIIILQVDDHRHSSKEQMTTSRRNPIAAKFRLKILTQFIVHFSLIPIIHSGVNKSIVERIMMGKRKPSRVELTHMWELMCSIRGDREKWFSETTSSSCCALCLADDYVSQRFFNSTRMRRKKSLWWESFFIFQSRHRRHPQFFSISSLAQFQNINHENYFNFPAQPWLL